MPVQESNAQTRFGAQLLVARPRLDRNAVGGDGNACFPGVIIGGVDRRPSSAPRASRRGRLSLLAQRLLHPAGRWCVGEALSRVIAKWVLNTTARRRRRAMRSPIARSNSGSYDPASHTYMGYDGMRHPCP